MQADLTLEIVNLTHKKLCEFKVKYAKEMLQLFSSPDEGMLAFRKSVGTLPMEQQVTFLNILTHHNRLHDVLDLVIFSLEKIQEIHQQAAEEKEEDADTGNS